MPEADLSPTAEPSNDRHNDRITLRFLAQPSTVNFGGKVHGGTVMSWIDEAAYACASAWSQRYCVTAFVGGIRFVRPIRIGTVVEVEAQLAYTGRTAMNIAVEVRSGDIKGGPLHTTTECATVMVAVDAEARPVAVAPFKPVGDAALALAATVKQRLAGR
jgi:acyl-CoA hydrolase